MKGYVFDYCISYGSGQGVVLAENKEAAIELLKTLGTKEIIDLAEIDMNKAQLIDFSWCE